MWSNLTGYQQVFPNNCHETDFFRPIEESKRILDEINLLKSLKHPNIISFISAWLNKRKEEVVFITEIVSGGSLKKYGLFLECENSSKLQ